MIKLNKIYTRSGDDGSTALADGTRRQKSDLRIIAYGAVDEANAAIGLARAHIKDDPTLDEILARLQNDLFDLGADLATPPNDKETKALRIRPEQTARLEKEIDQLNAALAPLDSFILPAGTAVAASLHLARTIMRRAERDMVAMTQTGDAPSAEALKYANRASDLLFVAARHANHLAKADMLWVAGLNQKEGR